MLTILLLTLFDPHADVEIMWNKVRTPSAYVELTAPELKDAEERILSADTAKLASLFSDRKRVEFSTRQVDFDGKEDSSTFKQTKAEFLKSLGAYKFSTKNGTFGIGDNPEVRGNSVFAWTWVYIKEHSLVLYSGNGPRYVAIDRTVRPPRIYASVWFVRENSVLKIARMESYVSND